MSRFDRVRAELSTRYRKALNARPVHLETRERRRGDALLYFDVSAFRGRRSQRERMTHTHQWESREMARTLLRLGYDVDVMSAWNRTWLPRKHYDVLLTARWNLERLADRMPEAVKILHAETAHIAYQNAAESRRLLELQQRRGITLQPRRFEVPGQDAERADFIIHTGNAFTRSTYTFAQKPMFRVDNTALLETPWNDRKDFAKARKGFMWFGSWGLVLKGLDLVLEAFADMPDLDLYVCGPITKEPEFVRAFARELHELPNIHLVGWVDVRSEEFTRLVSACAGQVNFSASEGGGGAVVTGINAGLIPIINHETSVDVAPDSGIVTGDSSVESIQAAVREVAGRPPNELREMARRTWETARSRHSKERFSSEYLRILEGLLG
jgi:glycosyltransferase involved in cell wall biosynthesis